MTAPAFYTELRAIRTERVLDASVQIISEQGWDGLTMTRVAELSGVPRQSLYKEVGTKSELGEAVVAREVDRFLAGVTDSVDRHPHSYVDGLTDAARFCLEYGETNAVLKAILRPGHDPELLALLTVRPEAVLTQAAQTITDRLDTTPVTEALVDTMVRLTLSHLLQPTVSNDEAVARIGRAVTAFA